MESAVPNTLVLETCEINLRERRVLRNGKATKLSPKEAELLAYLWARSGEIVTREELFTGVWGYSPNAVSRAVDATMLRLRKKIEADPSDPVHLFSLYGQGYRFVIPEEVTKAPPKDLLQDFVSMPTPTPPSAPSRRFGRTGSQRVGGSVTGEMVGRDADLKRLVGLLADGNSLVTLTGPGGMGKTRLAQESGRHFLNVHGLDGGVWFVDLATSKTAEDILQLVSDTLEIPLQESPDPERTSRRLGRAMTSRKGFLLILDNFEQVVEHGAVTVQIWRDVAKDALFLVTSRQALGLDNETVLQLAPLTTEHALELFTERARAVKPGFSIQPNQREVVEDIVNQLDRIPLAIRLAAGRSRLMSVVQIQRRLKDRFKLLRRGPGMSADRQATMEAAIDWSWNLLTEVERAVLQQCAVFRSGFTLEAAENVVKLPSSHESGDLREILDALSSKSLIFSDDQTQKRSRLNTYDSVRYYALERIQGGTLEAARVRHTTYFMALGEDLLSALKTPHAHEAFRILKSEIDNFQIVFARLIETDPSRAHRAFLCCDAMFSVMDWYKPILEMGNELLDKESELDPDKLISVQSNRATALHSLGRVDEARETLEWVRSQLNPTDHRNRWVRSSVHDSLLLARQGRYDEAEEQLQTLLADAENQRADLRADIIAGMGFVTRGQQRYEETIALWEEAAELGRGVLNHFWIEQTEQNLAAMQIQCGQLAMGRAVFEENLKKARGQAYPQELGLLLYNLAYIDLVSGNLEQAGLQAQEAAALIRNGVTPIYRAISCALLAVIHQLTGHDDPAHTLLAEAKAQVDSVNQWTWAAHIESLRAALMVYTGDVDAGRVVWEQAKKGVLELYPLTEQEVDTLWAAHTAMAKGDVTDELRSIVTQPGVLIPRKLGDFVPDPSRRGNPDHQLHLVLLEYKAGLLPK